MEKTKIRLKFTRLFSKLKKWITKNKLEFMLLIAIVIAGAFMRLYRIDEYMTFLGDEGRDVIIVRRLLVDFDPILVGPGTSIGNMYLGPVYYYMMAPFLALAGFSPVGPAVMVAILSVATIVFVWFVARSWFGRLAGVCAAFLYCVSPVVIIFSRSSWNPNIMPFFALLFIYSIWKFWYEKNYNWIIVASIAISVSLQSHYLALLLAPAGGFFWLISLWPIRKNRERLRDFSVKSLASLVLALAFVSPLIVFDYRHGWRNFHAMQKFFLERQTTVSARPWNALPELVPEGSEAIGRLMGGYHEQLGEAIFILLSGATLIVLFKFLLTNGIGVFLKPTKENSKHLAIFLVFVWLFVAFVGLALYKQEVYDHYYGFFFAAPFILLAGLFSIITKNSKISGSVLVLFITIILAAVMLEKSPLKAAPPRQLQRTVAVSQKILEEARGGKFNLAVIAERNYEGAYQYFLEKDGDGFVGIDPQRADETITEQLFVVCELPEEKCDPTNNPKAEVANFGWSTVESKWHLEGVVLYKLIHSQNDK